MTGSIISKPSTFQLSSTCSIRHCSIETETWRGCLKCLNEKRRSCSRSKGLEKTKTRIPRSEALSYFKHELVHRPIHVWGKRNVQLLTRFSGKGSFSPGYVLRRDCFTEVYFVWAGPLIRFPFEHTRIVEGFLLARRDEMRGSSDTVLWTLREYANASIARFTMKINIGKPDRTRANIIQITLRPKLSVICSFFTPTI